MTLLVLRLILRRFSPIKRLEIICGLFFSSGYFMYYQADLFEHKAGLLMWFVPFRLHPDATYLLFVWLGLGLMAIAGLLGLLAFYYDQRLTEHREADLARMKRRQQNCSMARKPNSSRRPTTRQQERVLIQ